MEPQTISTVAEALIALGAAILLAFVVPFIRKKSQEIDARLGDKRRDILYPILHYAIKWAQAQLPGETDPGVIAAKAESYVRQSAAETLSEMKVTGQHLNAMLQARAQNDADWNEKPAVRS